MKITSIKTISGAAGGRGRTGTLNLMVSAEESDTVEGTRAWIETAVNYHDILIDALDELVGEHDERARLASAEPGVYGINDTGGIKYARTLLAKIKGES